MLVLLLVDFGNLTNAGQNWTTSTDFLTNVGVSDIAIHPKIRILYLL
jgi:thermostable 8-oxoguanine DNA glycosylase